MRPPRIPDSVMPTNIRPSAPRRGKLGCSGTSTATNRRVPARREKTRNCCPMSVREWTVAGGLLETPQGVLLVRNQRRGGVGDWGTPRGGIHDEDEGLLGGGPRGGEGGNRARVPPGGGPPLQKNAVPPPTGGGVA